MINQGNFSHLYRRSFGNLEKRDEQLTINK